ncbi:hypothetical protein STCU_11346 [Strigomonas culicis]|uniref:PH domain-containing protein n=1 Tax=Strigomonas culicis TaxID=28005 RepID=S9THH7_9TRYP|nr:hypothetical protein STCU_11346 [Strigomonas culicis]|eukprot:EPY16374.1 hypothetical protein STCU_11346 [Strigomonas culicis]
MNSFEDRERWFNAVNSLIEESATHNRRLNIYSLIKRRLQAVSRYLKVDITLGHYVFLTEIEENLLQFVPEAVMLMVGTVTELVRMYEGEVRCPQHYVIMVHDTKEGGPEAPPTPPRYDPVRVDGGAVHLHQPRCDGPGAV